MLEHLPDPSTKGGGILPSFFDEPFLDGSGKCSSIKNQATGLLSDVALVHAESMELLSYQATRLLSC